MSEACSSISMSNPLAREYVEYYVSTEIQANRWFRKWPVSLQDEVEEALSNGSQGMFRWVVCQLDSLRRIHQVDEIRAAVKPLPKSLHETYQLTFSYINE